MWGYGSIGGIGAQEIKMWKVIALLGLLQSGDANLLFSTQQFPTEAVCKKAIPEFQKSIKASLDYMAKTHGNIKYALAISCVPSEGLYDSSKEPVKQEGTEI